MKTKLLLVLIAALCCEHVRSQSIIQADPLTGRATGGIPIWTINSGPLAASMGLSYSSGFKVNDGEGSAGVGWSFGAGGQVRREVRGLPDDLVATTSGVAGDTRNGWLYSSIGSTVNGFTPSDNGNYADCSDEAGNLSALQGFMTTTDTEPDVFSFHAPGLNGQFIFDQNKAIQTIPYKDLIISYARDVNNLINKIVITNNQGVKYTFTGGDKITRSAISKTPGASPVYFPRTYNYYRNDGSVSNTTSFYSSWNLASIKSPTGGYLTFSYGDAYNVNSYNHVRVVNSSSTGVDSLYTIIDRVVGNRLVTIGGLNEQATIAWSGGQVSSVSVKDLTYQSQIKKFNFTYHYVKATVPSTNKASRAYLSGVSEEINCGVFPSYKFTYYGVDFTLDQTVIPFDSGKGQDIFGYYNSTATSEIPELYTFSGSPAVDGERHRIAPASGYSAWATGGGRSVNSSTVHYGSMESAVLPGGSTTTITYEPAEYYDGLTAANIPGGGQRVKKIAVTDTDPAANVTLTYRYRSSTAPSRSSGQWTYRPMFTVSSMGSPTVKVPENLAPEEAIYYSRVEEFVTGRGKTVYEFQNKAMYGTTYSGDFSSALSRVARPNDAICKSVAEINTGYYAFPYAPNTNYDFERGLPLRVSSYTSSGKLVSRKVNTYQRTTLTVNQVYGIRFEYSNDGFIYQKYPVMSNVDNVIASETTRAYEIGSDSVSSNYVETAATYTYNGNQMVSQTSVTGSDGNTLLQTFKYAKDYSVIGTNKQGRMIGTLVATNRHATPIEAISYNAGVVTGANITIFNSNFGGGIVLPEKTLTLGTTSGFTASTVTGPNFIYDSTRYYPTAFFDAYDSLGNVTTVHDPTRSSSSVMRGYRGSLPVLDIRNARADQIVYSDFEPFLNTTFNPAAPTASSDYWSGKYSLALSGGAISASQSSIVRGKGKNYRFSCWAKAGTSVNLDIKINGTVLGTAVYTSAGSWQYVEKIIDMSSVTAGSSFSFLMVPNGAVNIDNLAFYPETSTISAHVYDPIVGKTADLDSRGNSGFQEYDALGRLRFIRNQDKDIVQIRDYHYRSSVNALPVSHFVASINPTMFTSSSHIADASCMGGVSYTWYVDGVTQASTSTTMNFTFNQNKDYRVRLLATYSNGTSATEMIVHPKPVPPSLTISKASGETNSFNCADVGNGVVKHITASISGCYDTSSGGTTYEWYYTLGSGAGTGSHFPLGTTTVNTLTYHLTPSFNNYVYCIIRTSCPNLTSGAKDQYLVRVSSTEVSFFWTAGSC